ncbi:MAG TPA: peptidylprolyl isomerase [Acidimicrobiales bacterium]|nr:peptidylprolyl isomerase [Acidimicrobiales bacterium]
MIRSIRSLVALVTATVVLGACGSVSPYAAKVNGEEITQRELDIELHAILKNKKYLDSLEQSQVHVTGSGKGTFDTAFVARILTRQIFLELVHQEVVRRKVTVTPSELDAAKADVASSFEDERVLKAFDDDYERQLVVRTAEVTALQAALAEVKVDNAAIEKYHAAHEADFRQTCVSHVLVDDKAKAEALHARITGGEDFAAVATAESKDPGSASQGGSLGCVGPGNFVPEFETAMAGLQPGQVSDVVQTQFGFHVLKVTDRKVQPVAEVRDQIRQQLLGGSQQAFNDFLTTAMEKSRISINPRYGTFVKKGEQPGVVPPKAPSARATRLPGDRPVEELPTPGAPGASVPDDHADE